MQPISILAVIIAYFLMLLLISYFTSKNANNDSFFIGGHKSPWYLVAFGMIGASLSGVTFISVPGWVGSSQFSYMQMVFGYFIGYLIISNVLLPLYYKLNLVSIYTYLETRFGKYSYKTGASFFLLSRVIGAAFRLFLVAQTVQYLVFDAWHIPFFITVLITILLIWLYTFKGGIKTIVWTDSFQTAFMLIAVFVSIYLIYSDLGLSFSQLTTTLKESKYTQTFFFNNWNNNKFFVKSFLSGIFIAVVMTGLDQDMMQKNLSCKNLKDAQKNMFWFSLVLVIVNFFFLILGALLYIYANKMAVAIPLKTDNLFPEIAMHHLSSAAGIFFILGLIAAAYSSADSALTALTTSVCVDFLNIEKKESKIKIRLRKQVHILMSLVLFIVILIFNLINDESVISALFKAAGYTYGPLLGLFSFGLFTKKAVQDKLVPYICILSPILCYALNYYSKTIFNGYQFGFELLILNGLITFIGLLFISKKIF